MLLLTPFVAGCETTRVEPLGPTVITKCPVQVRPLNDATADALKEFNKRIVTTGVEGGPEWLSDVLLLLRVCQELEAARKAA